MNFEWNPKKASENFSKHGVSFSEAEQAFNDFYAIEEWDDAHSTAQETRFKMIAMSGTRILVVHYTMRGENYRIISTREAENYEREIYDQARSDDVFYQ
jgi:uncharacterized protein